jgi:hypothetical protein
MACMGCRLGELRDQVLAGDDRAAQAEARGGQGLGGALHHDVGAVADGAQQGRGGHGGVADQGDLVAVGQVGDGLDVEETLLGVRGQLTVEEAGVLVDLAGPLVQVGGVQHPAALDVALVLQAHGEVLEGAAVALGGGHEVALLERIVVGVDQERVHRGHDRGHARGGGAAGGVPVEAVGLEQRHGPLVVVGARVGDPGVAPGGDHVGQGGGHLVRVPVGLARGHEDGLDDGALVVLDRFLDRVQAVHRDGVELPLLDHVLDVVVSLAQVPGGLVDVVLHSGGEEGLFGHGRCS